MNTNKLYNLDEVDKLTHILPKLNDEDTGNVNRPVTSKGIETVIKPTPPTKKA